MNFTDKLLFPGSFDLRYIFNDINLSFDIPFAKYRDIQSKDVLYKIFIPITKRDGPLYLPYVEKDTLYNWIKYKNYEIDNYKVKPIRGFPKEVFFKLKIMDFYIKDNLLNNGEIVKINVISDESYYDILFNGIVYKNINSENIVQQNLVLGSKVDFYNKKAIFADIEIFRKGIITFNIDTTPFSNLNPDDIDFRNIVVEKINFFIRKVYNSNQILTTFKNLYLPIDANTFNIGYNNYPKFNLSYKLLVTNNIDFSYSLLTSVFKRLYPFVYIQGETLQIDDIIEYYDLELSQKKDENVWVKGTIKKSIKMKPIH